MSRNNSHFYKQTPPVWLTAHFYKNLNPASYKKAFKINSSKKSILNWVMKLNLFILFFENHLKDFPFYSPTHFYPEAVRKSVEDTFSSNLET